MEILTVTFCGHSNVPNADRVEQKVVERLKTLLEERKPEHAIFYCGGYGDFDGIASKATRAVQSILAKEERSNKPL